MGLPTPASFRNPPFSSLAGWPGEQKKLLCMFRTLDVGVLTKSPFQRRKNTTLLKKQVKFTDDFKCCSDILTTVVNDKERGEEMTFVENDKESKKGKLAMTFLKGKPLLPVQFFIIIIIIIIFLFT
jgi:hypothetical protein